MEPKWKLKPVPKQENMEKTASGKRKEKMMPKNSSKEARAELRVAGPGSRRGVKEGGKPPPWDSEVWKLQNLDLEM